MHQLTQLDSGITVVTEHMPAVRSATLGLWIGVGSRDETGEQAGCSHFLEHLLFKGTSRRSARDIAEALDAVGGEMNAFTSKELTCFYARVLDQDLPLAFDVLADMVVDATNAEADVEAERQVVLSEIDIHVDTPDDLVHSDFSEVVLGTHPLALETLGSADSITRMTRDTVDGYYRQTYRPHNLTVAAAGNVDHDAVVRLTDELLGDLHRPGGARPARVAPREFGRGQVRVRHRPTEQAHVVLGVPGLAHRDEDRWALRVLNTLLGGGMSSRLFQEIREVRGLAYSTYSYTSSYTDGGLFGAYVGTAPAKVDEALQVLREQLDVVADEVTAAEVERAKGALTGGTVLSLEDSGSRMSRLGKQIATGADIVTVDDALLRIGAVTADDVRRVAARVLQQPRDLAVVGPFDVGETDRFAAAVA
ncbi:M16 family metallopeptidase [Egicoccus halophilus]|uniref:Putative zinc protease n=1 Tax=Egicoccus halophilus TaxID=1670830 RepID=A0A8J3ES54_9ACTN|nr:pitrilysin family protein [Egicoccus halophilus]GGI06552.1 putative zinc protease [Egicoccus halophilus]